MPRQGRQSYPPSAHPATPRPELTPGAAESLAVAVRESVGLEVKEPLTEEHLSDALQIARAEVVVSDELMSDIGGAEAMLVPVDENAFVIVVDPRPYGGWRPMAAMERSVLERRRLRFRVAHEMAHSFFYRRESGRAPRRTDAPSQHEERFCDEFAAALLLPPAVVVESHPTTEEIYLLANRFDVSVQLVARSMASYHLSVASVALLVEHESGPEIQWSSDSGAAIAALEEWRGFRPVPADAVQWASRGAQRLRLERLLAAVL